MKLTSEQIESAFFEFVKEHKKAPSRKAMVDLLGVPGSEILNSLGRYSENLERVWGLNERELQYLGNQILENDVWAHTLTDEICFIPVWCAESKVMCRKGRSD